MIEDLWYKHALIYNFPLSGFLDADGDGIGDFAGAVRRLDYLQSLGITAIWLAPFQPSPMRDHGYDISDYYGVHPRYGTLGDFVEFARACKQRGIRLIIDLVVNHCSDQHPWFQKAISDPDSRFGDYFIWADHRPDDAHENVMFPGVQKSTWTYSRKRRQYYYHQFYDFQPDLNIANPEVQREILKIVGFWLELGVSGFRMDSVPLLIEQNGIHTSNAEPAFGLLRDIRALAQWRKGDAVLMAEANIPIESTEQYFGKDGERLHMILNFPVNQTLFYALASADSRPLRDALNVSKCIPGSSQWAHFLRNHDELNIERLPDQQKQAVFTAFAPDERMQIYGRGIRRRLAPMLGGDRKRLELANSILMTLPGTPVIRYGDEIGMGDDLSLPERDAARTPMQWSADRNAGFSECESTVLPVIADGPYSYKILNVTDQRADQKSFLSWMERIIRVRKELPEIGWGDYDIIETDPEFLAIRYHWKDHRSVFVHNLADRSSELVFDPGERGMRNLVCVLSHEEFQSDSDGTFSIVLEPYGYRWLRSSPLF